MDARKDRIGEHAADHPPAWAIAALGPVPAHPLDQLAWQKRAAAPDARAAWYEGLGALGPADGPDVRGMPDGRLLHLRDTYPVETAWAPSTSGMSYVRFAPPPGTPACPACAPPPTPAPPPSAAIKATPRPSTSWPPATRPWNGSTGSAKPCSLRRWLTAPTGRPPLAPSAS